MTNLNKKTILSLLYLVAIPNDFSTVSGLTFMTNPMLRRLSPSSAFRRNPSSSSNQDINDDNNIVSIRAAAAGGSLSFQDESSNARILKVDTTGFGNADRGVERFRNEMIDLVYIRSLNRMNELSSE